MSEDNLITRVGRALWGERWQAPMAEALGVHRSTVQDWRQGRNAPRPGVYADLLRVAQDRAALAAEAVDMLTDARERDIGGRSGEL